jgi:hypothetical protein
MSVLSTYGRGFLERKVTPLSALLLHPRTASICTLLKVAIPDAFASSRYIFRVVHSRVRPEP